MILLLRPRAAHAKGGSSRQVDATGPKSDELKALESQFYSMMNPLIGAYTMPLDGGGSYQAAAQQPATQTASAGKAKPAGLAGRDERAYDRAVELFGPKTQAVVQPNANLVQTRGPGGGNPSGGGGVPQPYDNNTLMGQLFNDATRKTYAANSRYDDLFGQAQGYTNEINDALARSKTAGDKYFSMADDNYADARRYLQQGEGYLSQAGSEGDWWYDKAKGAYASAEGLLPQITSQLDYTNKASQWYDDYTRGMLSGSKNLLDTGQIPQPIIDALQAAMTSSVDKSVGTNLSDLAARGVINSSVTNRGMADMSKSVADSMNENYLKAFQTILGGYNDTAATGANAGKAFADINLNVHNAYSDAMKSAIGLGDSYGKTGSMRVSDLLGVAGGYKDYSGQATSNANSLMGAGSQRIQDWLGIAGGYGNAMSTNLAEREALMNDIQKYYTNAAAPMMPAYDFLKTMQTDHWNSDKKDTIVKQGK